MKPIVDIVQSVITAWNNNLISQKIEYQIKIETKVRIKTFEVSIDKEYKQRIAELLVYKIPTEGSKEKTLLLYRKESRMPDKKDTKYIQQFKLENEYIESLYLHLLYEGLGTFTIACEQHIIEKDYCEYDIIKERLKPNPEYEGYIVETISKSIWYEEGDKFEVFTRVDDGWGVYTAHTIAKANGGIFKIPLESCKLIADGNKQTKVEIITL